MRKALVPLIERLARSYVNCQEPQTSWSSILMVDLTQAKGCEDRGPGYFSRRGDWTLVSSAGQFQLLPQATVLRYC